MIESTRARRAASKPTDSGETSGSRRRFSDESGPALRAATSSAAAALDATTMNALNAMCAARPERSAHGRVIPPECCAQTRAVPAGRCVAAGADVSGLGIISAVRCGRGEDRSSSNERILIRASLWLSTACGARSFPSRYTRRRHAAGRNRALCRCVPAYCVAAVRMQPCRARECVRFITLRCNMRT